MRRKLFSHHRLHVLLVLAKQPPPPPTTHRDQHRHLSPPSLSSMYLRNTNVTGASWKFPRGAPRDKMQPGETSTSPISLFPDATPPRSKFPKVTGKSQIISATHGTNRKSAIIDRIRRIEFLKKKNQDTIPHSTSRVQDINEHTFTRLLSVCIMRRFATRCDTLFPALRKERSLVCPTRAICINFTTVPEGRTSICKILERLVKTFDQVNSFYNSFSLPPAPISIHRRFIAHHKTEKTHRSFRFPSKRDMCGSNLDRYVITRPTEIMKVHGATRTTKTTTTTKRRGGEGIRRTRCTDRGRETNCVKGCGKGSRRRKEQVEAEPGRNGFTISHESLVTE